MAAAADSPPSGPLSGLRIVELASENAAYCGKILAEMGAEVLLVEPPGGHHTRGFGPFVNDVAHQDSSLWFWHYNTSKLGVTLDLTQSEGAERFRQLVRRCDVVLEAEPIGRLARLGLDEADVRDPESGLIWVSVTPFGRSTTRADEAATDLTILSGGGPVWNCGYDDHTLPPVRGGGNQAMHIASVWAAVAAMVAVTARETTGRGQLVDVSMHAAANVTTEQATYNWLVARRTVLRQTARHAAVEATAAVVALDRDGREVHTGFPPRTVKDLSILVDWLASTGLTDDFADIVVLELAIEAGGIDLTTLPDDPLAQEFYRASRDAMVLLASRHTAYDFFVEGQQRGLTVGIIYSPEEVMTDPHLVARGFPTSLHHDALGRSVLYPGLPVRFTGTPGRIRTVAPSVGADQERLRTLWSD